MSRHLSIFSLYVCVYSSKLYINSSLVACKYFFFSFAICYSRIHSFPFSYLCHFLSFKYFLHLSFPVSNLIPVCFTLNYAYCLYHQCNFMCIYIFFLCTGMSSCLSVILIVTYLSFYFCLLDHVCIFFSLPSTRGKQVS